VSHAIAHALPGVSRPARRVGVEPLLAAVVIFVVAFAARFVPTVRGGGLFGLHFYDDGVHFAAATGLVHGRMPYRDFILLHPPGIVLILAPFAAIGTWVGDARGFALARLAFMVLGAVNALLVSRYLREVGVFAAWFGGLFYALFWPAIYSEHTVLLEGPANTCLLLALVLLAPVSAVRASLGSDTPPTTRRLVVAGALLGLAMTIKIWGVVPVVVVFGWLVFRFRWRRAGQFLLGVAAATTVICLPFFLAAPRRMWRMVVLDQLQRNDTGLVLFERLTQTAGLTLYRLPNRVTLALVLAGVLVLSAVVASWSLDRMRPVVLLLVALGVVLLLTPTWFVHYSALTAGVTALVVGAGAQRLVNVLARRGSAAVGRVVSAVLVVGLAAFSLPVAPSTIGSVFPGNTLGAAVARRPGCITSDHPTALILMGVLNRNLQRGCPLVVDLGGASYDLPSPARGVLSRRKNEAFQRYALTYLKTGNTMILARFYRGFGLSDSSLKTVRSWPVVARAGHYDLRSPR